MSRTTTLTLCLLASLVLACAQPGAEDVAPASNCIGTTPMAGGWTPTQTVPPEVFTAIGNQLVETGNNTWVPCDDPVPTLIAACSQVVAGQNFQVVAELACEETASTVEVAAEVFVPLPYTNEDPEVTDLQVISVDGKPVF